MRKIIYVLTGFILLSCSVQKRKYQSGYYVSWRKTKPATELHKSTIRPERENEVVLTETVPTNLDRDLKNVLEKQNVVPVKSLKKNKPTYALIKPAQSNCDNIIFRNGDEIKAVVLEITTIEIKYKKCDMEDSPTYVARKADVFMIHYANGQKEMFKKDPLTKNGNGFNENASSKKEEPTSAILSLIFGITGFILFFGSIPAIVLGAAALSKIKKEPDKYEGQGLAIAGMVLGALKLILLALIIALLVIGI